MAPPNHPSLGVSPTLLIFTACVLWMANSGEALSCFPCEYTECDSTPLKCPYGVTKDVCGCCDVCANGVGQECGGESGILGRCGKGLRCDRRPRGNEALPIEMTEGICLQDIPPPPTRRGPALPTKWKKLGEDCGGQRGILGKCVKGLRCDRSPRGNEAMPIRLRKGVCVPGTTEPIDEPRRVPSLRSDRPKPKRLNDKPPKKQRTTASPPREEELDNHLDVLNSRAQAPPPPLWYVRARWQQRRHEAANSGRQVTVMEPKSEVDTRGTGQRAEKQRRKSETADVRQKAEEPERKLYYF